MKLQPSVPAELGGHRVVLLRTRTCKSRRRAPWSSSHPNDHRYQIVSPEPCLIRASVSVVPRGSPAVWPGGNGLSKLTPSGTLTTLGVQLLRSKEPRALTALLLPRGVGASHRWELLRDNSERRRRVQQLSLWLWHGLQNHRRRRADHAGCGVHFLTPQTTPTNRRHSRRLCSIVREIATESKRNAGAATPA